MNLVPRTLFGRLALIMTVGLIVAQLAGTALHLSERQRSLSEAVSGEMAQRLAAMHRALNSQATSQRATLAEHLSTDRLMLTVASDAPPARDVVSALPAFAERLRKQIAPGFEIRPLALPGHGRFGFDVYIQLEGLQWLRIQGEAPDAIFAQPWHVLINLGVMLIAITAIVIVVARAAVRPLTRLASAAHDLADDLNHPPLDVQGPSEVRAAVTAFNTMQTRIRHNIEERERFLAAVSHDLKTPLTRLRLRAAMLGAEAQGDAILNDVQDMQSLIDDALGFLRGRVVDEPTQAIDLVALIESVADDFAHESEVSLDLPSALRINGQPRALQRALRNLVQNALKYGRSAEIHVDASQAPLVLTVCDQGPGLAQDELEAVFEPFYRVEDSRNRDTGGAGLGLAIVRQVARNHGGDVTLRNRPEGGLCARWLLPSGR